MNDSEPLGARFARAGLDWIVPRWDAPSSVQGFVTTRNGAAAKGTFDLGRVPSDGNAPAIAENRRRVDQFLPAKPVWLEQVHGAAVAAVGKNGASNGSMPRADAAITREPGVVLAVRVADCLPVLFADRDGSVIGVSHAGWRGLAAGVLENTIDAMRSPPQRIVSWLGPAIGPRAFEVGEDVYEAFVGHDARAAACFIPTGRGKWHANLEALARMRLADRGVRSVHGGGLCTHSDPARFFSFRRDGAIGRMAAFLWRVGR